MMRLRPADLLLQTPPLLLWLALNLLTLLLPVFQVPLSENFIRPVEHRAIDEMIFLQIASAALLVPFLFRNLGTTLALVAASWPFLLLAGFLSATPNALMIDSAAYISVWLLLLGLANYLCRPAKARLLLSAAASLFSIGGAGLWYIHAEFASTEPLSPQGVGPILDCLEILHGPGTASRPWLVLFSIAAITVIASIWIFFRARKPPTTDGAAAPVGH